jgi:hypothetical protein
MSLMRALADVPFIPRFVISGMAVGAVLGGAAGLVIGLFAYPPTAWFAVIEVGIPGAIAGGLLGLVAGSVAQAIASTRRRRLPRRNSI